jgi:putative protease
MTIPLELLAPAKNADIGMAAIDHGADAVYIGAPQFSARAQAGNSMTDIQRLIHHAHLFHAKVYVALNTILTDAEIPLATDMIHGVFDMGTDGLIIQDTGLLEQDLPPIPLIASTQMHNTTPEKVKFLEDVGFRRVILARELSCGEIHDIRRATTIELEAFVHGALCVSYSGRCYMSQAVAKRSGNRGVCAQPCRSRYTLTDGRGKRVAEDKFLLSLKDLNLSRNIPDLVAAGVTSFKIEGRYKDMDYVKNVVAAYRAALDAFLHDHPEYRRASAGASSLTFTPDLNRTFNRGYTSYFFFGQQEKVGSPDTQKSLGQYVGMVSYLGRDFFRINNTTLQNGDGLCFFNREENLVGFRIDIVKENRIYPNSLKGLFVGAKLYRNHDHAFSRILNKTSARRQITLEMEFEQDETGVCLRIMDETGITSRYVENIKYTPADNLDRMKELLHTQLCRTGDTPYLVNQLTLHVSRPGFISLGILNNMRRKALCNHTRTRLAHFPRQIVPFQPNTILYPETALTFTANIFNESAKAFYRRHGVRHMEPAFETLSDGTGKIVMTCRYCIRHQLDACLKRPESKSVLKEPLYIDDGRHRYRLEFDCKKCQMCLILQGP